MAKETIQDPTDRTLRVFSLSLLTTLLLGLLGAGTVSVVTAIGTGTAKEWKSSSSGVQGNSESAAPNAELGTETNAPVPVETPPEMKGKRRGNSNRSPGGVKYPGIKNNGNSCYLSSALQALASVPELTSKIFPQPEDRQNGFSAQLAAILDALDLASTSPTALNPRPVLKPLCQALDRIGAAPGQQDAHEAMLILLSLASDEWAKSHPKGAAHDSPPQPNCWPNNPAFPYTPEAALFSPVIRTRKECCNCHHKSDTFQPALDLAMGLIGEDGPLESVEEALLQQFQPELIAGRQCDNCKGSHDAIGTSVMAHAPPALILHLQRHDPLMRKVNDHIAFPMEGLEISALDGSRRYRLVAAIMHHGNARGGHYNAFALRPNGWFFFDDTSVVEASEEDVLNAPATVLVYVDENSEP